MNELNQVFRAEEGASAGSSIIYHRMAMAERKGEHHVLQPTGSAANSFLNPTHSGCDARPTQQGWQHELSGCEESPRRHGITLSSS